MSSTLETLNVIYEQVKNKIQWGQGGLYSKDGTKVCLAARLYAINDTDKKDSARSRLYEALTELNEAPDLAGYNDSHTHAEVVQLVVRAIAIEKRATNGIKQTDSSIRIS